MKRTGRFLVTVAVMMAAGGSGGCTPVRAPPVMPSRGAPPERSVREAEPAPDVEVAELPTTVTTSPNELVRFLERELHPSHLPDDTRAELAERKELDRNVESVRVRMESSTVFVRRTNTDDRAAVLKISPEGFLVVPIAWIATVVQFPGVDPAPAHAFYVALQRQLVHHGRASGLVRFDNGNAIEVSVMVRDVGRADVEVFARRRFFRAGAYDPKSASVTLAGVGGVRTTARNDHRGVSIHDLLRSLPAEERLPANAVW